MIMNNYSFSSPQDFTQAAFNRVAELVSQHGQCALENFVPAFSTEQCLEHMALVASEMAYDYSYIDAHADISFEEPWVPTPLPANSPCVPIDLMPLP